MYQILFYKKVLLLAHYMYKKTCIEKLRLAYNMEVMVLGFEPGSRALEFQLLNFTFNCKGIYKCPGLHSFSSKTLKSNSEEKLKFNISNTDLINFLSCTIMTSYCFFSQCVLIHSGKF